MISEQQEQLIIDYLNQSNIKSQLLKDDLIDHLCCLVEIYLEKGLSFDTALQRAQLQTAPGGLNEIEKETIFLLNYTKIKFMKRLMYGSGYLFTLSWVIGIFFKVFHIVGAGMLLGLGAIGIAFIFVPMFLINRYKYLVREVLSARMKWILGMASITILVLGISMKMLHLMGAGVIFGLGVLLFGFGYLPFLFFRMYQKSVDEI